MVNPFAFLNSNKVLANSWKYSDSIGLIILILLKSNCNPSLFTVFSIWLLLPKTERSLNTYLYLLEKGYDIRMVSFDRYIESLRNKQSDNSDVLITEDLSKLRQSEIELLIDAALDRKDYTEVDKLMKFRK